MKKVLGSLIGFCKKRNAANPQLILFLKMLFKLRHGVGHRKGEDYEKAAKYFGIDKRSLREVFTHILFMAIETIQFVEQKLLKETTSVQQ